MSHKYVKNSSFLSRMAKRRFADKNDYNFTSKLHVCYVMDLKYFSISKMYSDIQIIRLSRVFCVGVLLQFAILIMCELYAVLTTCLTVEKLMWTIEP